MPRGRRDASVHLHPVNAGRCLGESGGAGIAYWIWPRGDLDECVLSLCAESTSI